MKGGTGPSTSRAGDGGDPAPAYRARIPVRDGWWVIAMVPLGTLGLTAQAVFDYGDPFAVALGRSVALSAGFGLVLFGTVRAAGLVWDGARISVDGSGLRAGRRPIPAAELVAARVVSPQQVEVAASTGRLGGRLGGRRVGLTRRIVPRAAVPAVLVEQRGPDGPPRWWLIESGDPERLRDAIVSAARAAGSVTTCGPRAGTPSWPSCAQRRSASRGWR